MDPGMVPGARIRHPGQPDWGVGQVQSAIGWRVTANFEHAGKRTIDIRIIALELIEEARPPRVG